MRVLFSRIISVVNSSKQVMLDGIFTHFACADEENLKVLKNNLLNS